ncbi:Macrophage killing protein with similarity to conjugation protein [Roseomonas sp. TAS13]|uniref:DotI/IcmL/TraM family protein n=1 Tax=Roseomonas TaxID=125216 RepID=UPI000962E66C|nr:MULTISPECIES: DotI/IcmL/TraM family protein [Roseomonas]MCG7351420.1 DotI/IcmL family type IV secretion protein [Roseomonas mucosa]MCG7358079.1 DotI/IcmL family type IV secretion protein [Roseomonas mucosa]GAV35517.1 Macrophage killing protein with similarity to conjugation protein [Roseomonas sp. TAS13]
MQNSATAVQRRISDPDFQAALVRWCLGLTGTMAVLMAFLLAHDAYMWLNPPAPKYFFVDGRNPPRPAAALDSPIVDDVQLLQWAVHAILATYSVDYHNYPSQLNTAGMAFSQQGWTSFARSYIGSGNFEQMKKARLLCYAQAQRAATIPKTDVINGRLAYQVQFPMVQTCENTQQFTTQTMMMTATVMRTDDQRHPDGLIIEELVATPR